MIHELFPAEMDPTGLAAAQKKQAVAAAQAIICISENTRQDLLRFCDVPPQKIHVIPLAPSTNEALSFGPEPVPEEPFFLYVGQRGGYKNFAALLAAFAQIASKRADVRLCVVGPAFHNNELASFMHMGIQKRIEYYGYVSDEHLAKLYRSCAAFVYPSLYEGFGLPVLEAMACGAAVIACNSASIPEVAGDAALLFNAGKKEDLTEALLTVLDDASMRANLAVRGLQRAKCFRWEDTVAQTVDVYHRVVSEQ